MDALHEWAPSELESKPPTNNHNNPIVIHSIPSVNILRRHKLRVYKKQIHKKWINPHRNVLAVYVNIFYHISVLSRRIRRFGRVKLLFNNPYILWKMTSSPHVSPLVRHQSHVKAITTWTNNERLYFLLTNINID